MYKKVFGNALNNNVNITIHITRQNTSLYAKIKKKYAQI